MYKCADRFPGSAIQSKENTCHGRITRIPSLFVSSEVSERLPLRMDLSTITTIQSTQTQPLPKDLCAAEFSTFTKRALCENHAALNE